MFLFSQRFYDFVNLSYVKDVGMPVTDDISMVQLGSGRDNQVCGILASFNVVNAHNMWQADHKIPTMSSLENNHNSWCIIKSIIQQKGLKK